MDWNKIKRFNFTWAIPGGAWVEFGPYLTGEGNKYVKEWVSFKIMQAAMGQEWIDRQMRKQGWMTGCWVEVGIGWSV